GVVQDVKERAKAQTGMAMVFPGPGRGSPDRHAAEVLSAVASGLGGRLFEALRDRRSLAYTVLASSWQRRDAGAFLTYIAMAPEREHEAREAMLAELEGFRNEPVTAEELEGAVNYLAGQALVSRQSGAAVAGEIVEAWLIGTGLEELEDPAAGYRSVSREDVQRLATGILEDGSRAEGVVRGS
ncbi:MAG: M16 family metallopeptidase, partial [Gemmatimonadales bacterium]